MCICTYVRTYARLLVVCGYVCMDCDIRMFVLVSSVESQTYVRFNDMKMFKMWLQSASPPMLNPLCCQSNNLLSRFVVNAQFNLVSTPSGTNLLQV